MLLWYYDILILWYYAGVARRRREDASWFVQQPLNSIASVWQQRPPMLGSRFSGVLECWSLGSKTRCESAEVSKVAVEDLCCLLFVFPTSALLKREENVALGTAAQLRWTAARTRLPHEARLRSETYPRILLASMSQTYLFCMSDGVCLAPCTKEPYVEGDRKTARKTSRNGTCVKKNALRSEPSAWSNTKKRDLSVDLVNVTNICFVYVGCCFFRN